SWQFPKQRIKIFFVPGRKSAGRNREGRFDQTFCIRAGMDCLSMVYLISSAKRLLPRCCLFPSLRQHLALHVPFHARNRRTFCACAGPDFPLLCGGTIG
ncbi:MAG: hypothetical protein OEV91_08165, partial [Desulfobulbaceae bacterium]|nr:hypothetical protein [Desulfobulbaceae bacterium]